MEKTFRVVALNESYGLSDEIKEKTGELYTCYVFDPELRVHCCEMTPSHELVRFDFYTEKEIDDELHSDLLSTEDNVVYMHCHSIRAMKDHFLVDSTIELDDHQIDEDGSNITDLAAQALRENVQHPPHAFML